MRTKLIIIVALALGVALAGPVWAQGTSPIQVTSINLEPASFNAGDRVTIKIGLKNGGAAATAAGMAYVDIFKADTWLASDAVFHAEQPIAAMAAGATRTVTFAARWTVPGLDVPAYFVRAAAIDPPNEFGNPKSARYLRSCAYSRPAALVTLPVLRLREISKR